ncbi:hypothetical protein [Serratia ureilytica]|uniref:hypothetical protein n=1 Tax=Serratia ureilytica TaxID=300181 RepID=UPI0019D1E93E|nr:hypothetical protein [Serratia ureilytica]MBN5214261.1 hypothetical protein [Serratia ureilytica]
MKFMTNKMTLEIDLNNLAEVTKAVNQLIAIEQHLIMTEQIEGVMDTTVFNEEDLVHIPESFISSAKIKAAKLSQTDDWEEKAARITRINFINEVLLPHAKKVGKNEKVAELISELNRLETR